VDKYDLLLTKTTKQFRCKIHELLITVLLLAYRDWTSTDDISIDLEGHGRDPIQGDIDLSSTVGWFTCLYPIKFQLPQGEPENGLDVSSTGEIRAQIDYVRSQLSTVPNQGVGFGVYQYYEPDGQWRTQQFSLSEIVFNYMGDMSMDESSGVSVSRHSSGLSIAQENHRMHGINMDAHATNNGLVFDLLADNVRYNNANALLQAMERQIDRLITLTSEEVIQTIDVTDFSANILEADDINEIISML